MCKGKKKTQEQVAAFFESLGCVLTGTHINGKTKVEYTCKCQKKGCFVSLNVARARGWSGCPGCPLRQKNPKGKYKRVPKTGGDCSKRTRGVCGKECDLCFSRSFAAHERAVCWSDKNKLLPHQVAKNSDTKIVFKCPVCPHEFEMMLHHVVEGKWCPYCAGSKLCFDVECDHCWERSFASHEKSHLWSILNFPVTPRDVFLSAHAKYWFDCDCCGHTSKIKPYNMLHVKKCGYCDGKKLCGDANCSVCFSRSFASHERASSWSNRNFPFTPRHFTRFSNEKFVFKCEKNHEFTRTLEGVSLGYWCPKCRYKTEEKVFKFLDDNYNDVVHQAKFDWCRSKEHKKLLPFDFCITDHFIIELDGPQHFVQISNWKSPEFAQKRDKYKEGKARRRRYKILRLIQTEVWKDTYDWKTQIDEFLSQ